MGEEAKKATETVNPDVKSSNSSPSSVEYNDDIYHPSNNLVSTFQMQRPKNVVLTPEDTASLDQLNATD